MSFIGHLVDFIRLTYSALTPYSSSTIQLAIISWSGKFKVTFNYHRVLEATAPSVLVIVVLGTKMVYKLPRYQNSILS